MVVWNLPADFLPWIAALTWPLHGRLAWRLAPLAQGALFARGRRTVASWLRAAGLGADFPAYYYFLAAVGRCTRAIAGSLLRLALEHVGSGDRLLFALDDTPTKRYGPKVQGAGVHRNPTPGPAGSKFLYGHLWVTLAWVVRHPRWGTLGLPLLAWLYVRAKDVPKLAKHYPWTFQSKLQLAAELVRWLTIWLGRTGRPLWLAADGAYAKRPFLKPVMALGVVAFSRLRKDARLLSLPPLTRRRGQRGPLPRYGKQRIDLAKRAGQQRGWQQLACWQYGERVVKTVKTFLATWHPAGGVIRVVIVREEDGWRAYFCTDATVAAAGVLEMMAGRTAIEQTFKDVKEVWGAGQQQVRNVYANIGAVAVNLILYSVVEAWAWLRSEEELVARPVWDEEERRPSHADKRRALQREILREEIRAAVGENAQWQEFEHFATRLLNLAA